MFFRLLTRSLSSAAAARSCPVSNGILSPRSGLLLANQIARNGTRTMFSLQQTDLSKLSGIKPMTQTRNFTSEKSSPSGSAPSSSISDILEREIQDEMAELSQQLSSDQFPGFSVETEDSDVKLSKQVAGANVTVRFTVSSSLSDWPSEQPANAQDQQQQQENPSMTSTLVSMPEFQVQITKNNRTLEMSCYFEEMEQDEETGDPLVSDPLFAIDELVLYEGQPKESEFAVSAEYFPDDLQAGLLEYLGEHGIDDEFAKNLVQFATSYEKKQYVGLMKRLKSFVSK